MTNEKMIRDMLGSPVPQVYSKELEDYVVATVDGSTVSRGDINFNRTKLLRDLLGSVIPQLWDPVNNKWVVDTGQGRGGSGGGEGGPVGWDDISGKPSEFTPSSHRHAIADIDGLQDEFEKVFTQVSSGKSLLETIIGHKGSTVNKVGDIATFEELRSAILAITSGGGNASGTTLDSLVIDRLVGVGLDQSANSDMMESIIYPSNFVADTVQIKLTEVV